MDFYGNEFDWYAVDIEGQIGIFSTAGFGMIPKAVQLHYQDHLDISSIIEQPSFGTSNVWKDFSKLGMFVFDWKQYDGPYVKKEEPLGNMADDLRMRILKIKDLPKINKSFKKESKLEQNDI
jgi:hypothetical protein